MGQSKSSTESEIQTIQAYHKKNLTLYQKEQVEEKK